MEKFQETYKNWLDVDIKLYNDCKHYLEGVLSQLPNNEVILNDDSNVAVRYDGGNHPEFDSNCFSQVFKVYLKGDVIYLCIEETNEYPIENICADELYNVANAVEETILRDWVLED